MTPPNFDDEDRAAEQECIRSVEAICATYNAKVAARKAQRIQDTIAWLATLPDNERKEKELELRRAGCL